MNYEFLTIIVAIFIGIASISTSILVALSGVKKSQITSLNETVATLGKENERLREDVTKLENYNEQLKNERETSRQLRQEKENKIFSAFEEKITNLTRSIEFLEKENADLKQKIIQLEKDFKLQTDVLTETIRVLKNENTQLRENIVKLINDNIELRKDLETSKTHRTERDKEIAILQGDIRQLQITLGERNCEIEKMEKQIEILQDINKESKI
jgi:chromosome segregation ATPase